MSVVIIGGHDRMVCQYKKICKEHILLYLLHFQQPLTVLMGHLKKRYLNIRSTHI